MSETGREWLRAEFDRCRPWVEAALEYDVGTHDVADVWSKIEQGHAQLWPLPNSVLITTIDVYPKRKALHWWIAGGDLKEIQENEPRVNEWAKRMGCDIAMIGGRKGWLRAVPGYREVQTVMVKDL